MLADLTRTPFAEILRRLAIERRSGDLQVRSGKIAKMVFFDHGRVVFAASNMKKDRLGEALVALGSITNEEMARARSMMLDRRRRFGEALVQAGVLDKQEVGRSVARQVKRIVLSLFVLPDGAAWFEERRCPIPLEYMVSMSVHRLLYHGIKGMKDDELVLKGLGGLDRWVTLASIPPFAFDLKACPSDEIEILEQSRRRATVRRLAWKPGGLSFPRLRSVYALLASGVLQDAALGERETVPQPVIQMETGTFLLSALRHKPDPTAQEAIREEVDRELQRSTRLDRSAWLKVSLTAPREELIRALEEKMERYHELLDAVGEDESLKTDIEVILGRASTMLRLTRQTLVVDPTATMASPPALDGEPEPIARASPTPRPSRTPLPMPVAVSGPPASVEPTPAAPAAAPAEPAAEEIAVEPPLREPAPEPAPTEAAAAASPAASAPAEKPAAPLATPAADDSRSWTGRRLEDLLMEAGVRMTVSDYANAVRVYAQIVDLEPRVASHHVRLAIAMACYPPTAKKAEREFLEALRLDPDSAEIHYQFGIYYKAMKQRARALAEMRTAVRLNPRHKLARQELEVLSPKDTALTSLRKLFR